jgi:hypothetical protein
MKYHLPTCAAHHITFGGRCLNCGYDPAKIGQEKAKRNRAQRAKNQAMKDLGLVRVRGALGGTYWE